MKRVYRKPNPHLFDVAIDEIQTALNNECAWLNNIFGRCERLVKEINGRKEFTANWYKAKNDYILIAPDEGLGNFCFFVLDEPTDLENYFAGDVTRSTVGFSLIVWCDLRTIGEGRDTEAVKEELLQILNGRTHLRSGRMTIDKVYERAENIFREFDYDEIDNQYLMHPFAGFRIQGELIVDTLCDAYIPPIPPEPEPAIITGHIVDGSKEFTFLLNGNSVTVDVDNQGWWKYYPENRTFSAERMFRSHSEIDIVRISGAIITGCLQMCYMSNTNNVLYEFDIENCDLSQCENADYMFRNCATLTILKLPKSLSPTIARNEVFANVGNLYIPASFWKQITTLQATYGVFTNSSQRAVDYSESPCVDFRSAFANTMRIIAFGDLTAETQFNQSTIPNSLLLITAKTIKCNIPLNRCSALYKQSVINIITSAAANVTYTLHATIYAKCASGGEWNADVQAAIDAKAAQGFTVTLISA